MLIQPEDKKWNTNHHFEGLIDFCHVGKKNSIFLLVDSSYSSFYSSHQSHTVIELGQPVYVEVFVVKHKDKDLVLLLDDCWATRTRNPDDLQRWSLLKKGSLCFRLLRRTSVKKKINLKVVFCLLDISRCPFTADSHTTVVLPVVPNKELTFPSLHKRFIVQMFSFVNSSASENQVRKTFVASFISSLLIF